jgi:cyclic beta-1,2-glucan synthetase
MAVSHRHLLQWTTAAAAQAAGAHRAGAAAAPATAPSRCCPTLLRGLAGRRTRRTGLACWLCLLWAPHRCGPGGPAGRARLPRSAALPPPKQAALEAIARDTWRCSSAAWCPADHHLPPDNLQTAAPRHGGAPHLADQHRPVPAERGLRTAFGWIDTADLLPVWRPRWPRWTAGAPPRPLPELVRHADLAPLLPMYVSTVDSGNLSGHLLAWPRPAVDVRACRTRPPGRPRLLALARPARQLAWQADFALPVPPQAPPAAHRLAGGRTAARRGLLRPAGLGVAPDQPAGHRQGRRAGAPLGGAGPAVLCRRRAAGPALVVGLDVRVPDAHLVLDEPPAACCTRPAARRCASR